MVPFLNCSASDISEPPGEPQAPSPAQVLPEEPIAPEEPVAPELPSAPPAEGDDWWASSGPSGGDAPPTNQTAEVVHPLAPPADDEADTPTAPFGALTMEQAHELLTQSPTPPPPTAPFAHDTPTPPAGNQAFEGTRQLDSASTPTLTARTSRQGLAAMAARDLGRVRETNQDSVFAMLTTLPREGSEISVGLFIVADGMGGHQGGEVASRLAVSTVVRQVVGQLLLPALDDRMSEALQPLMIGAVQAANEAIWESAQVLGTDMGTTCTAALMVGSSLYLAHVGDSRAYLYEPGGLRQLTTDHSTVGRLIQLGQLDASEAREHPLRNQLYRTVGQQPNMMVDFIYQQIGQGSHLLLCSDGLWGMVDEPLMEQALTHSPWPQDACNELIALANLAGGDDNISAVVVALPIAET